MTYFYRLTNKINNHTFWWIGLYVVRSMTSSTILIEGRQLKKKLIKWLVHYFLLCFSFPWSLVHYLYTHLTKFILLVKWWFDSSITFYYVFLFITFYYVFLSHEVLCTIISLNLFYQWNGDSNLLIYIIYSETLIIW